jgi:hypothetical protein
MLPELWLMVAGAGQDLAVQDVAIARRTPRRVLAGTAAITSETALPRPSGIPAHLRPDFQPVHDFPHARRVVSDNPDCAPAHALPDTLLTDIPARHVRIL